MAKKSQTFEAAMERLDEIVALLESGETTLDESIRLFEEGTKLSARCGKLLDEAELKVTKLLQGPDGTPVEEALEDA